jgi:hypothetical protein
MEKLKYNPRNAYSILLAAMFLRRNPALEVSTTNTDNSDELEKEFKEQYPDVKFDSIFAVTLLKEADFQNSPNKRGKQFATGITGMYWDVTNFDTQLSLAQIIDGNKDAIKMVSDSGGYIQQFVDGPSGKEEKPTRISADDQDELDGVRGSLVWENSEKDKVVFNPHANGKWFLSIHKAVNPLGTDKPVTQDKPVKEDGPVVEEKPAIQEKPVTEDKPVTEEKPESQIGKTHIQPEENKTADKHVEGKKGDGSKKSDKASVSSQKVDNAEITETSKFKPTEGTDGVAEQDVTKEADLKVQKPTEADMTEDSSTKQ